MSVAEAVAAVDFDQIPTLGDIPRYHARERPSAAALVFEGRETDFATASGKILRRELREPYWAGRARRVN